MLLYLKGELLGASGWLSGLSIQLLIPAQVVISGLCDRAPTLGSVLNKGSAWDSLPLASFVSLHQ